MDIATAVDVISYVFAVIMISVAGVWVYLIKSMSDSFRLVPYVDEVVAARDYGGGKTERDCRTAAAEASADAPACPTGGPERNRAREEPADTTACPLVSVILPARNEEGFIGRCLDSLATQDYPRYEVVVIDDSSEDGTWDIISEFARAYPDVVVPVSARPKPEGWMGKNWACMEGFWRSSGDLLLFTDADTKHSEKMISVAVSHMLSRKLDALTIIPRMLALDFWTRATLPMISVFLHTRYSALNVNNPSKKTGYFFGSFFILKKDTYRSVGMHEGVREEMIEDGALGRKVKENGYRMQMVRGEHLVDAVWARDRHTLWNALKRLMIPLRIQSGPAAAAGAVAAASMLLLAPFVVLGAAAVATAATSALAQETTVPILSLLFAGAAASALAWIGAVMEARVGLRIGSAYGLLAPLGGSVISSGFVAGMTRANYSLMWRGRIYGAAKR